VENNAHSKIRFKMKTILYLVTIIMLLTGCETQTEISSFNPVNWEKRKAKLPAGANLIEGSTYLSIYSEVYERSEKTTHNLTATVSMKNITSKDTMYILSAKYYNTKGDLIRSYFETPVYINPLETIEIVVDQEDTSGGTGANFIFEWATGEGIHEPYFEAVMISTSGQLGISFTTQGVRR